jgi:hypothetical protein
MSVMSKRRRNRKIRPRAYRYSSIPRDDVANPHIVTELVKCGKISCRCARAGSERHGPYRYLRYKEWDLAADRVWYRREYIRKTELGRVRRWIRQYRNDSASVHALLARLGATSAALENARVSNPSHVPGSAALENARVSNPSHVPTRLRGI